MIGWTLEGTQGYWLFLLLNLDGRSDTKIVTNPRIKSGLLKNVELFCFSLLQIHQKKTNMILQHKWITGRKKR